MTTAKARLNHYQLLGVSPAATGDEIARAFKAGSSAIRPHAFGSLAELCVAYETLRDPARRRAYDASIGIEHNQKPAIISVGARQAMLAQGPVKWADVPRSLSAAEPKPAIPLGPGEDRNVRPEPRIERASMPPIPVEEEFGVEARPIDLRRTGIVLGTLVVAACAVGGLTGWWSADGVSQAAQPENSVSLPLPKAAPVEAAELVAPTPAPMPSVPDARPKRPKPTVARAARATDPTVTELAAVETEPPPAQSGPSAEQTAVEASETATAASSMPLPNSVVARTIHRIGYSCGSVASTSPIEGEAPGVFKVTCSSGQSYQARPVNGRYRFKRWR